jgi:hypothetical protein
VRELFGKWGGGDKGLGVSQLLFILMKFVHTARLSPLCRQLMPGKPKVESSTTTGSHQPLGLTHQRHEWLLTQVDLTRSQ